MFRVFSILLFSLAIASSQISITGGSGVGSNAVNDSNSSTATLASGATFTGTGVDVSAYQSVVVAVKTDQDGTLYVDFSPDNSNWDSTLSFSVASATNEVHRLTVTRKYMRVRFTNTAASAQTYFRLQTSLGSQTFLNQNLASVVQSDADAMLVRPSLFAMDISRSLISNMIATNKFGLNPDIDAGVDEDIWGTGGNFVQPTTAGTVSFVSSSANDTAAGTGARTITVNGLNGSYVDTTETVTLNGTTPVATVNSYFILHRVLVATSGATDNANAGNITGTSNGGGTPVMITMVAGKGQTQFCLYQIPAGYTGYMNRYGGGMQGGTVADIELYAKPFGGAWNLKGTLALGGTGSSVADRNYFTPLKFTAKTLVKLRASAASNNTEVYGNFDIILVAD